jgi:hypothetical protein
MFCRARRYGGTVVLGLLWTSGMAAAEQFDNRIGADQPAAPLALAAGEPQRYGAMQTGAEPW